MASDWSQFKDSSAEKKKNLSRENINNAAEVATGEAEACDWGFSNRQESRAEQASELAVAGSDSNRFIPIYERYLEDRSSFSHKTKNHSLYENNPQKSLRDWFDNEGHEFDVKTEQASPNQFICVLDLPLDEQDFTLSSETHDKKQNAMNELCMIACKMLDECHLLYSWQSESREEDLDKKRRLNEANKEDDIELDSTCSKRHCNEVGKGDALNKTAQVNTYESLMARWNALNMSILQLKAKLVKLDLSVGTARQKDGLKGTEEEVDEVDPLDEYMSSLDTKTKLSMDEKIEKSRLKAQISSYEKEQAQVSRFIELAKPKFILDKACPPGQAASNTSKH